MAWRTVQRVGFFAGFVLSTACSSQPPPAAAPARAVPPDCQAFVDHFRPAAAEVIGVEVFTTGDIYLPLLLPSREARRADELLGFLERPAPPTPKTAATLLVGMQEVIREQGVDIRGLLAALTRGDRETYRRLSIRYRTSRERLQSLDDSAFAGCGTHLLPMEPAPGSPTWAALQEQEPAFRKCRETARDPKRVRRLRVQLTLDAAGTVRSVAPDSASTGRRLDPGTESFFSQLGYVPPADPDSGRALPDAIVTACVLREARAVRFPATPGGATLVLPIELDR
jgi:hypothetical protein